MVTVPPAPEIVRLLAALVTSMTASLAAMIEKLRLVDAVAPVYCNVPPLNTRLAAEMAAAPRLLALPPLPMEPTDKVPPVRVVTPVKEFRPLRVVVPALVLVSVAEPARMAETSPVPLRA